MSAEDIMIVKILTTFERINLSHFVTFKFSRQFLQKLLPHDVDFLGLKFNEM